MEDGDQLSYLRLRLPFWWRFNLQFWSFIGIVCFQEIASWDINISRNESLLTKKRCDKDIYKYEVFLVLVASHVQNYCRVRHSQSPLRIRLKSPKFYHYVALPSDQRNAEIELDLWFKAASSDESFEGLEWFKEKFRIIYRNVTKTQFHNCQWQCMWVALCK